MCGYGARKSHSAYPTSTVHDRVSDLSAEVQTPEGEVKLRFPHAMSWIRWTTFSAYNLYALEAYIFIPYSFLAISNEIFTSSR